MKKKPIKGLKPGRKRAIKDLKPVKDDNVKGGSAFSGLGKIVSDPIKSVSTSP